MQVHWFGLIFLVIGAVILLFRQRYWHAIENYRGPRGRLPQSYGGVLALGAVFLLLGLLTLFGVVPPGAKR